MKILDAGKIRVSREIRVDVDAGTNFDVSLGEVVGMNEHFSNLVGSIGILAIVGVIALFEEAGVAALDGGDGVGLDFVHDAEDFPNLDVESGLGAEEDVTVGVGGFVTVIHQFGVGADLAIVASDEFQEAQHSALVYSAEDEW